MESRVQESDGSIVELVQTAEVVQDCLQRFRNGWVLDEAMNRYVENGQEAEANVAEIGGQRLIRAALSNALQHRLGWPESFGKLALESQVLLVPIILPPVFGGVVLDELLHARTEMRRLQEQQLDDETANLRLVPFEWSPENSE